MIVAAFQVARISSGGGADIGWATSLNSGISWTNGYLPGLTQFEGGGPNSGASDAAVAYDAKHGQWLICTLPIGNFDTVAVSRSPDGIHWGNPIYVITNRDADRTGSPATTLQAVPTTEIVMSSLTIPMLATCCT